VPEAQRETEPEPGALTDDRCQDTLGRQYRGRVICRHLPAYLPPGGLVPRKHGTARLRRSRRLPLTVLRFAGHPMTGRDVTGERERTERGSRATVRGWD